MKLSGMLGRGLLPRIGRWFPILGVIAVICGVLNHILAHGAIKIDALGFPVAMPFNFQYRWGYSLVSLTVVSLCAPDNKIAKAVERMKLKPAVDRLVSRLALLTYGVYVFHGLFLTLVERQIWLSGIRYRWYLHIVVFLGVSVTAFLSAWMVQQAKSWFSAVSSPSVATLKTTAQ